MREGETIEVEGRLYRVDKRIGRGRTADVHVLTATGDVGEDQDDLVIKLRVDRQGAVGGREISATEFSDEIAVLRRLAQVAGSGRTAFLQVRAVGPDGDWFVMDRAQGLPLHKVVGVTALTVEQIVSVCTQLSDALDIARRAGVRNTDLKLDAVFYEIKADHLIVIDWNVFAEWVPIPDVWIDPDASLVARVLDGLLRHKMVNEGGELPDWSRRFARAPARWAHYPRMFQGALTGLIEKASQVELDDLRTPLARIADALSLPREALVDEVVQRLAESRLDPQGKVERIREALGLAQLVMQSTRWVTALRGRLAFQACIERLGRDAPSIAALWRGFDELDADTHVPPGESLELARLRVLVAMQRKAIGLTERLRHIAEHFAALRWRDAARALREVLREVDRPANQETRLRMLFDEASGLARLERGLRRLDELVPEGRHETDVSLQALTTQTRMRAEALRDLDRGIEHLAQVEWGATLLRRLPEVEQTRAGLAEELARHELAIVSTSGVGSLSGFLPLGPLEPPLAATSAPGVEVTSLAEPHEVGEPVRDDRLADDSTASGRSGVAGAGLVPSGGHSAAAGSRPSPAHAATSSRETLIDYPAPWLKAARSDESTAQGAAPVAVPPKRQGGSTRLDIDRLVSLDPAIPSTESGDEEESIVESPDPPSSQMGWYALLGLVLIVGGGIAWWVLTRPPKEPPEPQVVRHTIIVTSDASTPMVLPDAATSVDARMGAADAGPLLPRVKAETDAAKPTSTGTVAESERDAARRKREEIRRRQREEAKRAAEKEATDQLVTKQLKDFEKKRKEAQAAKRPTSGDPAGARPGDNQRKETPSGGTPSGTVQPTPPPAGTTEPPAATPTDAEAEAIRRAEAERVRKAEEEKASRQKALDKSSNDPRAARPPIDDAFGKPRTHEAPR